MNYPRQGSKGSETRTCTESSETATLESSTMVSGLFNTAGVNTLIPGTPYKYYFVCSNGTKVTDFSSATDVSAVGGTLYITTYPSDVEPVVVKYSYNDGTSVDTRTVYAFFPPIASITSLVDVVMSYAPDDYLQNLGAGYETRCVRYQKWNDDGTELLEVTNYPAGYTSSSSTESSSTLSTTSTPAATTTTEETTTPEPVVAPVVVPTVQTYVSANGETRTRMTAAGDASVSIEGGQAVLPANSVFVSVPVSSQETLQKVSTAIAQNGTNFSNYSVYELDLISSAGIYLHQLSGAVSVTLPVPAHFARRAGTTIVVYRLEDDGRMTRLNTVTNGDSITFQTDHFSTYIITEQATGMTSPKTGENTASNMEIYLLIAAGALVALAGAAYGKKTLVK